MAEPAGKTCCTPARGGGSEAPPLVGLRGGARGETALIPGGPAIVGTDRPFFPQDGEGPARRTKLKPFRIGVTSVTNAEFKAFIDATNYVTEAERFGWSFVFWSEVPESVGPTDPVPEVEWWRRVFGANWQNINGPGTGDAWHPDHPVVQVSWNDARAYAEWAGGRLPSEAEWEHAARGGLGDVPFPWGEVEPTDTENLNCNIWQGRFPDTNTCADGHRTTAAARSFEPNGYGLFNMVGNVWEWTSDPFKIRSLKTGVKRRMAAMKGYKLSKGGSFLCHKSYCFRYRIAARSGTSPDSTTTHQGFRLVWPAD